MSHRKEQNTVRTAGKRSALASLVGVLALAVLGGCAVTTIDVDVYKGPLSNEDGVQTEQVAALAIAAKPLLVQLRDTLGRIDSTDPNYRFGFIPPNALGISRFPKNIHANRVNGLLSLYEDGGGDSRATALIIDGQNIIKEVHGYSDLLERRGKRDEDLIDALGRLRSSLQGAPAEALDVRRLLIAGYMQFFTVSPEGYRRLDDVVRGHIRARKWRFPGVPGRDFPDEFVLGDDIVIRQGFSTAAYELIADRDVVAAHAAIMFGPRGDSKTQESFVNHVLELANAFTAWRIGLEKGLGISLQYIGVASKSDVLSPDDRRTAIGAAATLVAELIDYGLLPKEVRDPGFKGRDEGAQAKLLYSNAVGPSQSRPLYRAWRDVQRDEARSFAKRLSDDAMQGGNLGNAVLDAHRNADRSNIKYRYGIAKGPDTAELPGFDDLEATIRHVQTLAKLTTAAGFDRGREDRGLESLVGDYLRTRDANGGSAGETLATERTLHAELTHFSEKLLFVADYDSLLQADDGGGEVHKRVKEYARVLQAVGNEILVSVNERRSKRNYDANLNPLGKQEVNAIKGTMPRNTADVLRRVASLLDVERQAAQEILAEAQKEQAAAAKQVDDDNKVIDALYAKAGLVGAGGHGDPDKIKKVPDDLKAAQKKADEAQKKVDDLQKKVDADEKAVADAQNVVNDAQTADDQAPFKDPIVARAIRESEEVNATPGIDPKKIDDAEAAVARAKANSRTIALADADLQKAKKKLQEATDQRDKDKKDLEGAQSQLKDAKKALEDVTATSALADQAKAKEADRDAAAKAKQDADARVKTATGDLSDLQATAAAVTYYADPKRHVVSEQAPKDFDAADTYARLLHRIDGDIDAQEKANKATSKPATSASAGVGTGGGAAIAAAAANPATRPTTAPAAFALAATLSAGSTGATVSATVNAAPSASTPTSGSGGDGAKSGDALPSSDVLKTARKVLSQRHFDQPIIETSLSADPRHVVDQLVSTYEYQYLEAVKAGGEDGPVARRLRQAIDQAKSYRAGMVHLISPAAFLRSSYPISSLQSGTATSWQNMLARHSARQLPIVGEPLDSALSGVKGNDAAVIQDLDRQNWQNINRVRVAGGGFTNYVMVKDDIGNWYVKSYVGDPQPIIDAAKALTLFGASKKLGADLIEQDRRRQAALDNGEDPPEPNDAVKAFQREAGAFQDQYAKGTAGDAKKIATAAHTMSADLQAAWAGDDAVNSVLLPRSTANAILNAADAQRAAAEKSANDASAKGLDAETIASKINGALGSLVGYEKALLAGLAKLPPADDKPLTGAKAALTDAQTKQATAQQADDFAHETVKQSQTRLATVSGGQLDNAQTALQSAQNDAKSADTALQAAKDSTKAAQTKVDDEQKKYDTAVLARTNARKIVGDQVGTAVAKLISGRASTLGDYQTAMTVLLQAKSSSDQQQPAKAK